MMQQAANPISIHDGAGLNNADARARRVLPRNSDRRRLLQDSTAKGLCKITKKKELLNRVYERKASLLQLADDSDDEQTNLKTVLEGEFSSRMKSKTMIRGHSNSALAESIALLFDIMDILRKRMEQKRSNDRSTRQSAIAATADPTNVLIEDILALRDEIDEQFHENNANLGKDPLLKGITLTDNQKGLQFDSALIPEDPTYRSCIFCSHVSINDCVENVGMDARNNAKIVKWRAKQDIWDEYEAECKRADRNNGARPQCPRDPHDSNKLMQRKPRKPGSGELESPMVQCMCKNSRCAQEGSDVGNTCFASCRKIGEEGIRHPSQVDQSDPRYPWNTNGIRGCTCPYCKCNCQKRYRKDQIEETINKFAQKRLLDSAAPSQPSGEQEVASFMSRIIAGGAASTASTINNQRLFPQGGAANTANLEERAMNEFYANTAEIAARTGGQLSSAGRETLRAGFGQGTMVTLPGGDLLDTRALTANNNAHNNNNRIPTNSGSNRRDPPLPGMVSKYQPDLRNVTGVYQSAVHANSSLAVQFLSAGVPSNASASAGAATPGMAAAVFGQRKTIFGHTEEDQEQWLKQETERGRACNPPTKASSSSSPIVLSDSSPRNPPTKASSSSSPIVLSDNSPPSYADAARATKRPPTKTLSKSSRPSYGSTGSARSSSSGRPSFSSSGSTWSSSSAAVDSGRQKQRHPTFDIWNDSDKKKKAGGEKVCERVMAKNTGNFSLGVKKKNMSDGQKKKKKRARVVSTLMKDIIRRGDAGITGNEIAMSMGVPTSQVSAYEEGNVTDRNGNYFSSQQGLAIFKNIHLSQDSSSSDDSSSS